MRVRIRVKIKMGEGGVGEAEGHGKRVSMGKCEEWMVKGVDCK